MGREPWRAVADDRVRLIGQEAVQADRELRRQRTLRDKRACEAYQQATGLTLPDVVSFRDEEGNLYEISVHAEIRLVERGKE